MKASPYFDWTKLASESVNISRNCPQKKILERKLHESIALSRALLESRTGRRDREKIMPKHETKANR
jgi:hypothetical protein